MALLDRTSSSSLEHDDDEKQSWQAVLEKQFAPQIDASLIAALVHEPGQTFDGAHATLLVLVGEDDQTCDLDTPSSSNDPSTSASINTEEVERALAEWKLIDEENQNGLEHLRMTDDEAEGDKGEKHKSALHDTTSAHDRDMEGAQLARDTSGRSFGGIDFLVHAFPTRTPQFLRDMLSDEEGDVMRAIETLTTLELIESGALDDEVGVATSSRPAVRMTDDETHLLKGTQRKKVTKRDRQRRKKQQAAVEGVGTLSDTPIRRVYLNDVRQGGSDTRLMTSSSKARNKDQPDEEEDDAALAIRLAREERIAAGLPPDEEERDDDVRDNDWLFSSSVLEQLGPLLDVPLPTVKGVYAACHMNLRATFHRLIQAQNQAIPSLEALDRHMDRPIGTASMLVDGLCVLLPSKSRSDVQRLACATGGREDAVLDLAQLTDRIESVSVGEKTDVLDPMKMDRGSTSAEVFAPTLSTDVGHNVGEFLFVDTATRGSSADKAAPYASAAGRPSTKAKDEMTNSRQHALQRLREGASSVTFPLNSAASVPPEESIGSGTSRSHTEQGETAAEAARLAHEYSIIAHEYRQRRQAYLSKAANSYRLTHNAATNRGPMRGAAAWVYADEARRLDAKARAFALEAAQATVRYRMLVNRSAVQGNARSSAVVDRDGRRSSSAAGSGGGDLVDLHGLTVHEALTITRQTLNVWWSKSAHQSVPRPLHIITGVGKHSRGNVALVRPAVLAMLQRERWTNREPQQGHILVIGRR